MRCVVVLSMATRERDNWRSFRSGTRTHIGAPSRGYAWSLTARSKSLTIPSGFSGIEAKYFAKLSSAPESIKCEKRSLISITSFV